MSSLTHPTIICLNNADQNDLLLALSCRRLGYYALVIAVGLLISHNTSSYSCARSVAFLSHHHSIKVRLMSFDMFSDLHSLRFCLQVLVVFSIVSRCVAAADDFEDLTKSGNYDIVYCKANEAPSHADYLKALIPYIQSILEDSVLPDLERGIASPAYKAYFKTNSNLDAVRQVFTDIISGRNVIYTAGNVTSRAPPTLVCAETDEPYVQPLRLMDRCNLPSRPVMSILQPNKVVSICPIFWTLSHGARKAACPWVSNGEIISPDAWNLVTTQFAVFVHEMAHMYNEYDAREEVYDVKNAVALNATRSLENAQNFAYYAACECFPEARKESASTV